MRTAGLALVLGALWIGTPGSVPAAAQSGESSTSVPEPARKRLESTLQELSSLRERISNERVPLAKTLNGLEEKVALQRGELEELRRIESGESDELETLRQEVESRRQQNRHVRRIFQEYVNAFETAIHVGEIGRYEERIRNAKLGRENRDLSEADRLASQMTIISASLDRLESTLGGERFRGEAMTEKGRLKAGNYTVLGPVGLFRGDGGTPIGWVQLKKGSPEPSIVPLPNRLAKETGKLVETGRGHMALDPTLGNAAKARAQAREGIVKHLQKGGVVMVPLILLALSAAVVSVIKWLQLRHVQIATARDLQSILDRTNQGDSEAALAQARGYRGPVGEMLETAVLNAGESSDLLEEMLYEKRVRARPKLDRLLPFIAVTAASAPLLGLLGTVTGMIETFDLITVFGTGDAQLLSSGISEALVTTEVGLIIAVPALLVHAFLARRARNILSTMDYLAVGFVNGLRR